MSNVKLFENKKIRSSWNSEQEKWYFSVIDVIQILTESPRPRKYWNALKTKLKDEGSQLSQNMGQLKMQSTDGKFYRTDVADTEQLQAKQPAKSKKKNDIHRTFDKDLVNSDMLAFRFCKINFGDNFQI